MVGIGVTDSGKVFMIPRKKEWRIVIEPNDSEFEEFRPWPGAISSIHQEVSYYTYKLMYGDDCLLECKMFVPIEFRVASDGHTTLADFEKFLEEAQK